MDDKGRKDINRNRIGQLQRKRRSSEKSETRPETQNTVLPGLTAGLFVPVVAGSNTGSTSAPEQNADQESNGDRVQGRFSSPASQAVKRRTGLTACFDSIGDGLSGFLDRLGSRLNGRLGLVELPWAIGILQRLTLAYHLNSPRQRKESTPGRDNRSQASLIVRANKPDSSATVRAVEIRRRRAARPRRQSRGSATVVNYDSALI
jgi:hypothetical protein